MGGNRRSSRRGAWLFVAAVTLVLTPVVGVVSVASPAAALTVTTTSASSTRNPAGYGELVLLDATVSSTGGGGIPTGTVTFFDGAQALGTASLNSVGQTAIRASSLAAGSHTITEHYNGDGTFAPSVSSPLTQVINPQGTTSLALGTINPAVAGDLNVLVGIVSANNGTGTPTGSMEFFAGAQSLGTEPLDNSGSAAIVWYPPAGHYAMTIVYTSNSTNWLSSTSPPFTEDVIGFTITTSSLPSATPGVAFGPVTLQAANAGTSTSPYVTTLKWKKVTLPKGLKLSSAGVLSGTPNKKLAAGSSSVTVQVTETVTTLNGKKKVKTKTTVQANIPLTIN